MKLVEIISELIAIPGANLVLSDYDCKTIMRLRESYRNSLRNTINREIENLLDYGELRMLIEIYSDKIEKALLISLYRRYFWLNPIDL